jgi:HEPN pEK499 p136
MALDLTGYRQTMSYGQDDAPGQSIVYASRNDSLEFARRTQKNLERIEMSAKAGEDVHVVTQLTVSLLGLIVFPWERQFDDSIKPLDLGMLVTKGWPEWRLLKGSCKTLGDLIYHLRNAVAHRRLRFSSDSPVTENVMIEFSDSKSKHTDPYWSAQISAKDLRTFCLKFIALLDDTIG